MSRFQRITIYSLIPLHCQQFLYTHTMRLGDFPAGVSFLNRDSRRTIITVDLRRPNISSRPSASEKPEHEKHEHDGDESKRQHHLHGLSIRLLDLLIARLNFRIAQQWPLALRVELAIAVAFGGLVDGAVGGAEGVGLRVGVVADALEALGETLLVLDSELV